jgi:inorganic pyrophosphatase
MKYKTGWLILLLAGSSGYMANSLSDSGERAVAEHSSRKESADPYTHTSDANYLTDYAPVAKDGDIYIVVEIPTGSIAKWEVTKPDGKLRWKFKKGKPRVVKYLGYPGNYGMIPQTLSPKSSGGDGDPLDVIVLSPAVDRGSVIKAKLIGVLKLIDKGEQDDKLIAVQDGTPLYAADSIEELNRKYAGTAEIVEIWFTNYKGPEKIKSMGYGNEEQARRILQESIKAYQK